MRPIYGVLNKEGIHTDISNSLLGAKQYATRNGFHKVSKRMGYTARLVAIKEDDVWVTK